MKRYYGVWWNGRHVCLRSICSNACGFDSHYSDLLVLQSLLVIKGDTYIVANIIGQIDKKRKQIALWHAGKSRSREHKSFKVR